MSHLAQTASFLSAKFVQEKDKQAWLGLFSENAVVQDPVGFSPLDVTGEGHKGLEAIAAFYDLTIASGQINMDILSSHPAGCECANRVNLTNKYSEDLTVYVEMIVVYRVNDDGKIVSLKAYWNFSDVEKQLNKS